MTDITGQEDLLGFNPRTREGCDLSHPSHSFAFSLFQSTHPRGVRLDPVAMAAYAQKFQSTHPRGVRHAAHLVPVEIEVGFQSTHPRGVRHFLFQ